MRGEGDLLDHQGTPGVQEDIARRRQPQQEKHRGEIDRDQDRLQDGDAGRLDPIRDQEDHLRDWRVDRRKLRVVDTVQNPLEERGHRRVDEELFGRRAVGSAGDGEAVAVPQVAVEVVLVERPADQPAEPERDRPDQ